MSYIPPEYTERKFTCPHCHAISKQDWTHMYWTGAITTSHSARISTAKCDHCEEFTLWCFDKMLYPDATSAPPPNPDLPQEVKDVYLEAASISVKSPRGAAALLRLGIQILCKELGEPGKDINTDIGSLVKKGLPVEIQQALDTVRVTGNEAVHPGQIDVDSPEAVAHLFELVNYIAQDRITMPTKVKSLFTKLPPNKLDAIKNRDAQKPAGTNPPAQTSADV